MKRTENLESGIIRPKLVNPIWVLLWTSITMIAFAANAILCRLALRPEESVERAIDPASYTLIRILAGAIVLLFIQRFRRPVDYQAVSRKQWWSPVMLALYAIAFSFAYIGLDTASGTLILFALVQLTMIFVGMLRGEFPKFIELMGLVMASGGLVYLVTPNLQTPLLKESVLMAVAGIAWGGYSVLGKKSRDPIADTSFNFWASLPLVLVGNLVFYPSFEITPWGAFLAVVSGGLASGLGYVIWYTVLPSLRSTQAAAIQLSVPVLAAVGGFLFVGDQVSLRTLFSGMLILVGIALTIKWKKR
ncbi:MAG: DMT family transporter [Planctomycetota bacterium]|nr:DMT family transporter [Planctomycetota bacterium]